jgi:hypothetical protein
MRHLLLCAGFAALLLGCGDNDTSGDVDAAPQPDAEVPPDAGPPPDAFVCAAFDPGAPGGTCAAHAECDSAAGAGDGTCLDETFIGSGFPAEGYCTIDNGAGDVCTTDADCGDRGQCIDTDGYRWCLPVCCDGSSCPDGQACFDTFQGFALDKPSCVPGDATAADGDPCGGIFDCNESSICRTSVEFPGGQCWGLGCTVGDDSTCAGGGHCIAVADYPTDGNLCVDPCTADTDCRMAEGYACFDPDGDAGDAQNYCRHPQAGDACTEAADCSGGSWTCQTGADFPGGHCTTTGCPTPGSTAGCGLNGVCYDDPALTPNHCISRCPTIGVTTGCRTGYTCADVGAVTGGGCVPL